MPFRRASVESEGDFSTSSKSTEEKLLVSGVSRSRGGTGVQVSLLRLDPDSRLQLFLLECVHNVKEAYAIFRRLGLPRSSVANNLPYVESALAKGGHNHVTLQPHMRAILAADASGTSREQDTAVRPKPRFKTHPPGLVEVFLANGLLIYALLTVKV